MEHRPLPHHAPAIRRYLNEPACLYGRLLAASDSDRKAFYIDSHEPQLRTVREDVSRREPSEANQFPFLCVFHFAGCDHKFANKCDWKDHVVSQHLTLDRVFWECAEGHCAHSEGTLEQCESLQTKYPSDQDELSRPGRHFASRYDFRAHLLEHHRPTKLHDIEKDIVLLPDTEGQWFLDRQDSSMRMVCGLPQNLGCPVPQCASIRFTGPAAWDQRLNHAAEHFLANPQCLGVFGGEKDAELVDWASSNKVGIHQNTPNDCGKSLADSGYSSMPGMPRHQNMSHQGDPSPALPMIVPEWERIRARDDHLDELSRGVMPPGIGGWARDHKYLESYINEESIFSANQFFQELLSQYKSIDTVDTSQDSDSSDESDGMSNENPEAAAVMQWFHGWLRQWLAPITRERPSGNRGGQNTVSQSQTSSGSNTETNKGTTRPRPVPKRKRGDSGEDDGNEESPKSKHVDVASDIRMYACPYFKRNPRKYGQPKWKSCAHPGYRDIRRMKQHMYRRHALPEYQCRRCRVDLKTSEALEAHSQQLQACTPTVGNQDGLNQEQVKRMRSKKGMGKDKTEVDKWYHVYSIAFPYDQQTPSRYLYDTDEDKSTTEFNLCYEFGRFFTRELPPLVGRYLNAVERPLPESIRDDITQLVTRLALQLKSSFLEEMGFPTSDNNEQPPENTSTTNDGASFVESTTTRRISEDSATTLQQDSTSEHPMTALPKGSTSQESMSMLPTSNSSKESTTTMPQTGYDTADSTMFQDGTFAGMGMTSQTMPPCFLPTTQEWQTLYQQLGYDPNLVALGFGGMNTS